MEIQLAVLADYASVSKDNKLNILGIFNHVAAAEVPVVHPQMFLVAIFTVDVSEYGQTKQMEIALIDQDGHRLLNLKQSLRLGAQEGPRNLLISLAQLKLPNFGAYAFKFLVNGEFKREVEFSVVQKKGPPPPDDDGPSRS